MDTSPVYRAAHRLAREDVDRLSLRNHADHRPGRMNGARPASAFVAARQGWPGRRRKSNRSRSSGDNPAGAACAAPAAAPMALVSTSRRSRRHSRRRAAAAKALPTPPTRVTSAPCPPGKRQSVPGYHGLLHRSIEPGFARRASARARTHRASHRDPGTPAALRRRTDAFARRAGVAACAHAAVAAGGARRQWPMTVAPPAASKHRE